MKLTKQQYRKFKRMCDEADKLIKSGRVKDVFPNMEVVKTPFGDMTIIKHEIFTQ